MIACARKPERQTGRRADGPNATELLENDAADHET